MPQDIQMKEGRVDFLITLTRLSVDRLGQKKIKLRDTRMKIKSKKKSKLKKVASTNRNNFEVERRTVNMEFLR